MIIDDDEKNSILIYLNMYKYFQKQWNMCKTRGIAKEGYIYNIEDKIQIKENKKRFQIDFKL